MLLLAAVFVYGPAVASGGLPVVSAGSVQAVFLQRGFVNEVACGLACVLFERDVSLLRWLFAVLPLCAVGGFSGLFIVQTRGPCGKRSADSLGARCALSLASIVTLFTQFTFVCLLLDMSAFAEPKKRRHVAELYAR